MAMADDHIAGRSIDGVTLNQFAEEAHIQIAYLIGEHNQRYPMACPNSY